MSDPVPPIPPPFASVPSLRKEMPKSLGLPHNLTAALAYFVVLVGGIAVLFLEKKDRYVRFHAMQSVLLSGMIVLSSLLMRVAEMIFGPIPLVGALMLMLLGFINAGFVIVWFCFWIAGMASAYMGKEWSIPYLGALARGRLGARRVVREDEDAG